MSDIRSRRWTLVRLVWHHDDRAVRPRKSDRLHLHHRQEESEDGRRISPFKRRTSAWAVRGARGEETAGGAPAQLLRGAGGRLPGGRRVQLRPRLPHARRRAEHRRAAAEAAVRGYHAPADLLLRPEQDGRAGQQALGGLAARQPDHHTAGWWN